MTKGVAGIDDNMPIFPCLDATSATLGRSLW